jgi:hypothetical protein
MIELLWEGWEGDAEVRVMGEVMGMSLFWISV